MEAMMPEQSSVHFYLNWAKERIDEVDATLASLEAKAGQVQADSKVKANALIADLQKRRSNPGIHGRLRPSIISSMR
jgi:hypothetical protein